MRARLLLETVIDAAAGLRRELALPAVSGAPADRIEEELGGASTAGGATAASATSPRCWSSCCRCRGHGSWSTATREQGAWPASALDAQRTRLVTALAPLVADRVPGTTVVFDAAESEAGRPSTHRAGSGALQPSRCDRRRRPAGPGVGRAPQAGWWSSSLPTRPSRATSRATARGWSPEVLLELLAR